MPLDPKTIVQILILTVGIHVVLSFLRTTRGSGLIRGVGVALLVVFGGLLGLSRSLKLAELEFIVEGVSGFFVVILAIVFQPELRRGIVSIGDSPLLRRVMGSRTGGVVDEVAAACVSMAKRKQGALIAFERQASLVPYTQTAARIDARVQRDLLDSIFHTGGALHDGAVVIREDRIAAAMVILPLSDNDQLARSVGTRHRAALGLTEETDSVVVAVSEETGLISVFQGGTMERRVVRDELADVLRAQLGGDDYDEPGQSKKKSAALRFVHAIAANPGQKLMSLLLGIGLFLIAFRSVTTSKTFTVEVRVEAGADARTIPTSGVLRIVLPAEGLHLASPAAGTRIQIDAEAAHADFAAIAGGPGGVLVIDDSWIGTEREINAGDIVWGVEAVLSNIKVELKQPETITVRIEQYGVATIAPTTASLAANPEELESGSLSGIHLPVGIELDLDSLEFNPATIQLRGPSAVVERIRADPSSLAIEEIDLESETGTGFVARVRIDRGELPEIEIVGDLFLRGRLRTRETELTRLELDVALVSFNAATLGESSVYLPPTETVTVLVKTRRLFPDGIDESARTVMRQELLQLVRTHARVFVDVDRAATTPGSRATVEVDSLEPLWREELGLSFELAKADPNASLRLEIDPSDLTIALTTREPAETDEQ